MQVKSNVLLPVKDAVARVPLEVIPDLFSRIEFRGVGRESFEVKSGISVLNFPDVRAFVNTAAVPNENDVPTKMAEKQSEKLGHLRGLEVVLPELHVQAHPSALGGHGDCRDSGDAVVPIAVADDSSIPCGSCGPSS